MLTFAFERMTRALSFVRGHFPLIIGAGGVVLIALGLLIITGEFTVLNAQANSVIQGTGLEGI